MGVNNPIEEIVDVVGWRIDDVVELIRGKKGSVVRLEVSSTAENQKIIEIVKLLKSKYVSIPDRPGEPKKTHANIDKISEPTTEVQAKGTTVHQALEDLYDLPQSERTTEKLHNLFREAWTKVRSNDEHHNLFETVEEERDWGVDGLKLLNNYMQIEDPTSFEPLERERWVRGSIEDLNLRGILDRMDRNNKGELVIVDYKSGKAPMAKYKEPRFFALKLYALLIKEELNEMPAELKLIYLKNSTIHTLKISDEDLTKANCLLYTSDAADE